MADSTSHERRSRRPAAAHRRSIARRAKFVRRRTAVLLLLLAIITGLYFGVDWALGWVIGLRHTPDAGADAPPTPAGQLSFKEESFLTVADLNGDGVAERIAVGPVESMRRKVALVTGQGPSVRQLGEALNVPALPLTVVALPRAKWALVLSRSRPVSAEPKSVTIPGGQAIEASGGEPFFEAWVPDISNGLVAADYYALAAPMEPPKPTALIADKYLNALWLYENGQLSMTLRIATGRYRDAPPPSAQNQAVNYITPVGTYTITNLQKNPFYYSHSIAGGDPNNPLGTRLMGFSVFAGDRANLWAIHGTDVPDSIGRWVSDGCIRLANPDVEKLFDRVQSGMTLQIVDSRPK